MRTRLCANHHRRSQDMKQVWRGLMLAEEGSLDDLRKVVAACNDPEAQGHFVTALKDAKPGVSVTALNWQVSVCVVCVCGL